VKILMLRRITLAQPTQWVGFLENGDLAYIRFRNGKLSIGRGQTYDEAMEPRNKRIVAIDDDQSNTNGKLDTWDMLLDLSRVGYRPTPFVWIKSIIQFVLDYPKKVAEGALLFFFLYLLMILMMAL